MRWRLESWIMKKHRDQLREEEHKYLTDEEFAALANIEELRTTYKKVAGKANDLLQQFQVLKEKRDRAEKEPRAVRAWMEKYWGFVMGEHNLTEVDDDSDEGASDREEFYDPLPIARVDPTPSELAREEVYNDLQAKRERTIE